MIYPKISFRLILKCVCVLFILVNSCVNSFSQHHNYIDDINTTVGVNILFHKIMGNSDFDIADSVIIKDKDCKRLFDSLHIKVWSKGDFDNNGYTDLLVISHNNNAFCILDSGINKFFMIYLSNRFKNDQLFSVSDDKKMINYHQIEWFRTLSLDRDSMYQYYIKKGTLTYKFDCFIENNDTPKDYKIESIVYHRSGCLGSCPIFDLKINNDKSVTYKPQGYNKIKLGVYESKLEDKEYQRLIECLNYLNFPSLKDKYAVSWTDAATSILKITYENGKTKTIEDYGLIGTFGLSFINRLLLDIVQKHRWE